MAKSEERESEMSFNGVLENMPIFTRELIAGGVAGGIAKTSVAPLERVKILFQTRQAEFRSMGLVGSFTKIARTEGILGFYRGNGATVVRVVPYAALHYMTYEEYKRWIILAYPDVWKGPVLDLVAGSLAGGTALLFTYPLDLVRTKLAFQVVGSANSKGFIHHEQLYRGIRDCFSVTYKEAGLKGLYRGIAPSLYGIFPYAGLKFYFFEKMKSHVPEDRKNDVTVKLISGSVAGLLGQTFTYPLDVVRRQMQVERMSNATTNTKGTFHRIVSIFREHGWKHLFSGLSLNCLKVVPTAAISFTVYDSMKLFLQVPSRDKAAVIEGASNHTKSHSSTLHS